MVRETDFSKMSRVAMDSIQSNLATQMKEMRSELGMNHGYVNSFSATGTPRRNSQKSSRLGVHARRKTVDESAQSQMSGTGFHRFKSRNISEHTLRKLLPTLNQD